MIWLTPAFGHTEEGFLALALFVAISGASFAAAVLTSVSAVTPCGGCG